MPIVKNVLSSENNKKIVAILKYLLDWPFRQPKRFRSVSAQQCAQTERGSLSKRLSLEEALSPSGSLPLEKLGHTDIHYDRKIFS